MSRAARDRRPLTATEAAVNPALRPFFDAIAELLVAEEARTARVRRELQALTSGSPGKGSGK